MNIDGALEYAQNALERAFENWLETERPSGDCESVHRQWDDSFAHQELVDELQPVMALTWEVRRLREENERLRKDAGRIEWQPIATAPRDGTKIVVIGNNYGDRKQGTHICIASCIDGLFYHENDDIEMNVDSGFFLEHLTHWMPLPEPMP